MYSISIANQLKIQLFRHRNFVLSNVYKFCTSVKETQVTIKGQTTNFLKVGNGNKAVLCFPGALGTIWSDFKPQIENLDRTQFTVIAFDPPGYGYSRPPERNFGLHFYEKDAEIASNLMKEIGVSKYSLLGWSDGGISSLILAAKQPDNIDNLIVWGSNSYVLPEELESYEKIRDIRKWSDKMKAPLINLYSEEGLQDMWNGWCDALQNIYKTCHGDICKESLSLIKCPTLIIHGNKDPMVAAEHPEYLLKNIAGAKLVRFAEGKHNIHLRYAKEFNQIVSDFILQSKVPSKDF